MSRQTKPEFFRAYRTDVDPDASKEEVEREWTAQLERWDAEPATDVSEDYKKQLDDQRQQFKQDLQEMADDMAQRMETMEANVKANVKEGIDQVEGAMEEKVAAEINSVRQDVQALGRQIDSTCDKFLLAVDRIPSTEVTRRTLVLHGGFVALVSAGAGLLGAYQGEGWLVIGGVLDLAALAKLKIQHSRHALTKASQEVLGDNLGSVQREAAKKSGVYNQLEN